jgi:predicted nucleic acid-binding protein
MSGSFFLDTNIFVYAFESPATAKARRARQLISEALKTRRGIVSYQVVQEFFNVAFRRFAQPISPAEGEQYFATVFRPILAVHSSPALYLEALRLFGKYGLSWYDSLIVAAASVTECEVLYTEDLQDGRKIAGLLIQNPFS